MNKLVINYAVESKKRIDKDAKYYEMIVGLTDNKKVINKFKRFSRKRLEIMLVSLNPGFTKGHTKFIDIRPSVVPMTDEEAKNFEGFTIE